MIQIYTKKLEETLIRLSRYCKRKSKFLKRKAWKKSIRHTAMKSRCRHARTKQNKGYRYKGGR